MIALWIERKSLSIMMRSELSLATSQPLPIQKPTSAYLRASASAILSPVIPIMPLLLLIPSTIMSFSSEVALAMIFSLFFNSSNFVKFAKTI